MESGAAFSDTWMDRVLKPTEEISSVAPLEGTVMENLPDTSVEVPMFEFFTLTDTPGNGLLLASVTVPVTLT
jgi:hypothetical protein